VGGISLFQQSLDQVTSKTIFHGLHHGRLFLEQGAQFGFLPDQDAAISLRHDGPVRTGPVALLKGHVIDKGSGTVAGDKMFLEVDIGPALDDKVQIFGHLSFFRQGGSIREGLGARQCQQLGKLAWTEHAKMGVIQVLFFDRQPFHPLIRQQKGGGTGIDQDKEGGPSEWNFEGMGMEHVKGH